MAQAQQYDAVIIGSGQGGNPLAVAFAGAGFKTALVERVHVGGTCINEGCTPTKTMVASARAAYLARRADMYGIHTGPVSVDMHEVRMRKGEIVQSFRKVGERRLAEGHVDLIAGEARFVGPKKLEVRREEGETIFLAAETIVINTGARPADPDLQGLDSVPHFNSTTIMELDEIPRHLLVLGGGYVGLEFGQMFRRFGSEVTVVQRAPKLMGREDPDIADEVADILQEDGIRILLDTSGDRVERTADGTIRLTVRGSEGTEVLSGSHLLVAAGRVPNTEVLNLGAAGVRQNDRGFVVVDDRLETDVPGTYAIGDVAGSPQFTHISYDDSSILRTNLLSNGNRSRRDRLVPYTIFIDPQLGRVGLTEQQARMQGRGIRVARIPMSWVPRAIEVGESRGVVKVVIDAGTNEILGAAVLAIEGGEIMAMLEIAMIGRLPYTALRDAVFAHPTLAELLNTLFATLDDEALSKQTS